jgi:hypothetical protein
MGGFLLVTVYMACGRRDRVWLHGAMAVTGVALVLFAATEVVRGPDFSADRFRAAAAQGDDDRLEVEARRAVDDRALIGFTADEVRRALGDPHEIARRGRVWVWQVGWINDFLGPGDGGAFVVRFDASRSRVTSAAVGQFEFPTQ